MRFLIDDGNLFDGTAEQFARFFSNVSKENVEDWCKENNYKIETFMTFHELTHYLKPGNYYKHKDWVGWEKYIDEYSDFTLDNPLILKDFIGDNWLIKKD